MTTQPLTLNDLEYSDTGYPNEAPRLTGTFNGYEVIIRQDIDGFTDEPSKHDDACPTYHWIGNGYDDAVETLQNIWKDWKFLLDGKIPDDIADKLDEGDIDDNDTFNVVMGFMKEHLPIHQDSTINDRDIVCVLSYFTPLQVKLFGIPDNATDEDVCKFVYTNYEKINGSLIDYAKLIKAWGEGDCYFTEFRKIEKQAEENEECSCCGAIKKHSKGYDDGWDYCGGHYGIDSALAFLNEECV